jgi:mRNA interferase RelE/StbE
VYDIYLESAAERDLKGLAPVVFRRLIKHIRSLAEDPRPVGCHKIVGSRSDWRIRVGDYRVIYEVDEKARTIKVMRIGHRREAYR